MTADLVTAVVILALTILAVLTLRWSKTAPRAVETAPRLRGPARGASPGAVADPPSAGGGTGFQTSIADSCNRFDELRAANERLHREIRRLESELRQAVAQRNNARRERDRLREATK